MNQSVETAPVSVAPITPVTEAAPQDSGASEAAAQGAGEQQTTASKREAALNDFVDEDAPILALEGSDEDEDEGGDDEGGEEGDLIQLENLEEDETVEQAKVFVCKKKCLECNHLVPWAEKAYKQCHFSAGNDNCPAAGMQIQILIPFDKIIPRFLAAEEAADTERLISLYETLKKKPSYVQDAIHARLKEEREKRAAK